MVFGKRIYECNKTEKPLSPTLWEKLKIEFLIAQAGHARTGHNWAGNPRQVTPKQAQIDPMQPTFSTRTNYFTHAIISYNPLLVYYPIFEDHFFVFKEVFSENSVRRVSIQDLL